MELRVVCSIGDCTGEKRVLVFVMEASSESTGSSLPALYVESDIRDLKREIKNLQRTKETIDTKGGRRLENVERSGLPEEGVQTCS